MFNIKALKLWGSETVWLWLTQTFAEDIFWISTDLFLLCGAVMVLIINLVVLLFNDVNNSLLSFMRPKQNHLEEIKSFLFLFFSLFQMKSLLFLFFTLFQMKSLLFFISSVFFKLRVFCSRSLQFVSRLCLRGVWCIYLLQSPCMLHLKMTSCPFLTFWHHHKLHQNVPSETGLVKVKAKVIQMLYFPVSLVCSQTESPKLLLHSN